jgi:hypothetical protein
MLNTTNRAKYQHEILYILGYAKKINLTYSLRSYNAMHVSGLCQYHPFIKVVEDRIEATCGDALKTNG